MDTRPRHRIPAGVSRLLAAASLLIACATHPPPLVVDDAQGVEPVSGMSAGCSKPFELERDCSIWDGANREILIESTEIKVAGSEDGRHVLMMAPSLVGGSFKGQDHLTNETNRRYHLVKGVLASRDIAVIRVIPMVQSGAVVGYFLELDGDGYEVLVGFSG
ncbi:MAG: hypothetical protein QNK04_29660 [Myxococcota bacterium]|nr:hypothetical protein [Myxococcota bacterium]